LRIDTFKVISLHKGGHQIYHCNIVLLVKNAIDEFINEKENSNIMNIKLKNSSINDNKIKIEQEKIKIIDINEALKKEKENNGLLAKFLKNNGIDSIIEINELKDENDTLTSNFLFIINGATIKKKYKLIFDPIDEQCFEIWKNKLKIKISKEYNISSDDLILANYKKILKQ